LLTDITGVCFCHIGFSLIKKCSWLVFHSISEIMFCLDELFFAFTLKPPGTVHRAK
jgi:hypothetical protein